MDYLPLATVWIAWCTLHSGMISLTATEFFRHRLGAHYRFYRLAFNLVATLVTNVVLTVYLLLGAVLEERKLVVELGEAYREYQRKVPMFLPFKWPRLNT